MSNHIEVLCFDFDGTVADTMPFLSEIAVTIICKYYHVEEAWAKEKYIETTGLPFAQQLQSIFPGHEQNQNAADEFEGLKKDNYLRLPPIPQIQTVLKTLQERSYSVVISSSTLQPLVTEYAKHYQIPCDLALGYREHFKKGHDHFECIMQHFQVEHQHLCYIGDSLNDYRLATADGVQFIGKTGLFSAEAFHRLDTSMPIIHEMEELLDMF